MRAPRRSLPMVVASVRILRIRASGLLRGGRQELVVDQGLQRVKERVLGVNRLCEPSLAQLDGAHERPRSFRGAVSEREIRVLVPLANQLPKVPRAKTGHVKGGGVAKVTMRTPRLADLHEIFLG